MPQLKQVDLSKSKEHKHPDIIADNKTPYLAKIRGNWFTGTFNEQWFGLSFYGWYNSHLQFDAPGWNTSGWEELFEIVD